MVKIKVRKSFIIAWGFTGIFLLISYAQAQQENRASGSIRTFFSA
jgi:hypothetical protein